MNAHKSPVHRRTEADMDDRKMRGTALKKVMETALSARQMSVSGLAREANVQRGDIYRWWRGESRPTRNSLARVAETLQVDTSVLRRALGEPDRATPATDLAAAISSLADELRADREERQKVLADRLAVLELAVERLAQRAIEGAADHRAPRVEAR